MLKLMFEIIMAGLSLRYTIESTTKSSNKIITTVTRGTHQTQDADLNPLTLEPHRIRYGVTILSNTVRKSIQIVERNPMLTMEATQPSNMSHTGIRHQQLPYSLHVPEAAEFNPGGVIQFLRDV